jgi:hypothetical protein
MNLMGTYQPDTNEDGIPDPLQPPWNTSGAFTNYVTYQAYYVPEYPNTWGPWLTTTYTAEDVEQGFITPTLSYFEADPVNNPFGYLCGANNEMCDWTKESNWKTLQCLPLEVTEYDACSNIAGIQAAPPAEFHASNEYCYPIVLAQQGSITLNATPSPAGIGDTVTWTYTISPDYFEGTYLGVVYQIPRNATVTWSGDITNSAFTSGNPATSATKSVLTSASPTGTRTVTYTEKGSASVDISINDGYLILNDSDSVYVQDELGCPGSPGCEDGPPGIAAIDSFTVQSQIVNEGDNPCSLSWDTSVDTAVCTLSTPSGDVNVATSTTDYEVGLGIYSLTCHNGAQPPQVVEAGPISCILNPDVKER